MHTRVRTVRPRDARPGETGKIPACDLPIGEKVPAVVPSGGRKGTRSEARGDGAYASGGAGVRRYTSNTVLSSGSAAAITTSVSGS